MARYLNIRRVLDPRHFYFDPRLSQTHAIHATHEPTLLTPPTLFSRLYLVLLSAIYANNVYTKFWTIFAAHLMISLQDILRKFIIKTLH